MYYTPRKIHDPAAELSHYIPIDFNQPSICGLSKDEWKAGTNNWDWVRCPDCLKQRPDDPASGSGSFLKSAADLLLQNPPYKGKEKVHTFQEAMAETAKQAQEENRVCYLYKNRLGNFRWGISAQYWDDWLFKAYPGGRKELSVEGSKELEKSNRPTDAASSGAG